MFFYWVDGECGENRMVIRKWVTLDVFPCVKDLCRVDVYHGVWETKDSIESTGV